MKDRTIYADTLPLAYHRALWVLEHDGEIVDCTNYDTRCKEVSLTMHVEHPMKEPMISRRIPCGPEMLQEYTMEMLDGIKDFCVGHGWTYTYHERIAPQIPRIIELLMHDRTTRQAFIDIRRESDIYLDDPPCLTGIQFMIRDGALDMQVVFRSNDAVKASYMNAFALIMLQKRIADELGAGVGTYTHRANSFHAYERDWELLKSYADSIAAHNRPLTYSYAEDWREQMDAAVPDIMRKVKELELR